MSQLESSATVELRTSPWLRQLRVAIDHTIMLILVAETFRLRSRHHDHALVMRPLLGQLDHCSNYSRLQGDNLTQNAQGEVLLSREPWLQVSENPTLERQWYAEAICENLLAKFFRNLPKRLRQLLVRWVHARCLC